MENKTLKLVLKGKWFDMILAGIKLEEYRDVSPYWEGRIEMAPGYFDSVTFFHGYRKTRMKMEFEVERIHIGTGKPEWGAVPGKEYFVIKLGKRIS